MTNLHEFYAFSEWAQKNGIQVYYTHPFPFENLVLSFLKVDNGMEKFLKMLREHDYYFVQNDDLLDNMEEIYGSYVFEKVLQF